MSGWSLLLFFIHWCGQTFTNSTCMLVAEQQSSLSPEFFLMQKKLFEVIYSFLIPSDVYFFSRLMSFWIVKFIIKL